MTFHGQCRPLRLEFGFNFRTTYLNIIARFDRNADNQITWTEFQEALLAEGLDVSTTDVIRTQVFANWDSDRNRVLSLEEIRKLAETWASFPGDQSNPSA